MRTTPRIIAPKVHNQRFSSCVSSLGGGYNRVIKHISVIAGSADGNRAGGGMVAIDGSDASVGGTEQHIAS